MDRTVGTIPYPSNERTNLLLLLVLTIPAATLQKTAWSHGVSVSVSLWNSQNGVA